MPKKMCMKKENDKNKFDAITRKITNTILMKIKGNWKNER